jgi:hypothetical protein
LKSFVLSFNRNTVVSTLLSDPSQMIGAGRNIQKSAHSPCTFVSYTIAKIIST